MRLSNVVTSPLLVMLIKITGPKKLTFVRVRYISLCDMSKRN